MKTFFLHALTVIVLFGTVFWWIQDLLRPPVSVTGSPLVAETRLPAVDAAFDAEWNQLNLKPPPEPMISP